MVEKAHGKARAEHQRRRGRGWKKERQDFSSLIYTFYPTLENKQEDLNSCETCETSTGERERGRERQGEIIIKHEPMETHSDVWTCSIKLTLFICAEHTHTRTHTHPHIQEDKRITVHREGLHQTSATASNHQVSDGRLTSDVMKAAACRGRHHEVQPPAPHARSLWS